MGKKELAICIGDEEYQNRFTNCLINHFKNQFRISVFTSMEELEQTKKLSYDIILIGDYAWEWAQTFGEDGCKVVFLGEEELGITKESPNVFVTDKYQPVYKIVDSISQITGVEQKALSEKNRKKTIKWGVYALSNTQLQMPFAITIAAIQREKGNVLLLDLQENSGLTVFAEENNTTGLEELLALAETGVYTKGRVVSAIGHLEYCDYVYPAKNSQCLTEADASLYEKMFQILEEEMDYDVIVINFGSRFQGFYEILDKCEGICFLKKEGVLEQVRQQEFMEEMKNMGYEHSVTRFMEVSLSDRGYAHLDCSQLIRLWQWGEIGDLLRKKVGMELYGG